MVLGFSLFPCSNFIVEKKKRKNLKAALACLRSTYRYLVLMLASFSMPARCSRDRSGATCCFGKAASSRWSSVEVAGSLVTRVPLTR